MNAKQELLEELEGRRPICADIRIDGCKEIHASLVIGYTEADWEAFLRKLNVEYDNGYGCQKLFGTVWLPDNVWLTRGVYNGSEWWEDRAYPTIPEQLKAQSTKNIALTTEQGLS